MALRKPCRRPLQPLPPRRIGPAAHRLDDPAQQPAGNFLAQIRHDKLIQGDFLRRNLEVRSAAWATSRSRAARPSVGSSVVPPSCRTRTRSKRRSSFEGSSIQPIPLASRVAVSRARGAASSGRSRRRRGARPRPPCPPAHPARSRARRAWPASRPGHWRGVRSAVQVAVPAAGLEQQPVARLARGLLDAGRGLGARPRQRLGFDAECRQPRAGRLASTADSGRRP